MHPATYNYLKENQDLLQFVRHQPIWYRYLARDPYRIDELQKMAKKYYGKTFPQRVERIGNNLQMIQMFMLLVSEMKD